MPIGTLNEGPLHEALKLEYLHQYGRSRDSALEVPVGDFVADVQGTDGVLYEIQTAGFGAIRRKLRALLQQHRVVLVYPIAARYRIVKLSMDGVSPSTCRRSPKHGHPALVASELVYIPDLLAHPNFEVEVVMVELDELRRYDPKRTRRRGGWRVESRELTRIVSRHRFRALHDLFGLLRSPLPEQFTTAELGEALAQPRRLAQKLAYVLREGGALTICGKEGNALRYQRAPLPPAE